MAKIRTGELSRTTISMRPDLYERATQRWQTLGYPSFSEYIQFLIEEDLSSLPTHVTERSGEKRVHYLKHRDQTQLAAEDPAHYTAPQKKHNGGDAGKLTA